MNDKITVSSEELLKALSQRVGDLTTEILALNIQNQHLLEENESLQSRLESLLD